MPVSTARSAPERRYLHPGGEEGQAFLIRVGEELASSLDYESTLQRVAHLAVPFLADVCLVELVGPDGRPRPVAVAHVEPTKEPRLRELVISTGAEVPAPVLRAYRTGRPVLVPEVSDAALDAIAQEEKVPLDVARLAAIHEVGSRSTLYTPLSARARSLGVLSLARLDGSPPFGPQDLPLVQQLARQCALAVDNADLYRMANEAVRVREELLAATSHELRTPLSEIKGFVSTLLRPDVSWDEAMRQEFLQEIEREADRLDALIGDLLDMSRLASGGCTDFTRARTRPVVLVWRGVDRVRTRLAQSGLDLDPTLGALPPVWVDAKRIEQVLANLIENGTKYAPGSVIHLSGRVAEVGATVELWVEDDGPGISDDDLAHLFDPFYRGRSRGRADTPGTGLGLAIARRIVEGHGGRIWAENRPGGGARFVVSLPAASACH